MGFFGSMPDRYQHEGGSLSQTGLPRLIPPKGLFDLGFGLGADNEFLTHKASSLAFSSSHAMPLSGLV